MRLIELRARASGVEAHAASSTALAMADTDRVVNFMVRSFKASAKCGVVDRLRRRQALRAFGLTLQHLRAPLQLRLAAFCAVPLCVRDCANWASAAASLARARASSSLPSFWAALARRRLFRALSSWSAAYWRAPAFSASSMSVWARVISGVGCLVAQPAHSSPTAAATR